jgi:hypothetical protein
MQNFIVLGIIPGTDYQTTFSFWMTVAFLFVALLYMPRYAAIVRRVRMYVAMRKIAHTIDRFDLITI